MEAISGYMGGTTINSTYQEVYSDSTGHAEATTPQYSGSPPTITGFHFSVRLSACSTETKKVSRLIWKIKRAIR
ncbi:MAG: hypothetical protein DRI01_03395 [Chloroflexi bacterium]|nr:MAG: hypothetical protein DRI01_03395 [Chloroflexota bacterium]